MDSNTEADAPEGSAAESPLHATVVAANQVLARHGIVDGWGHVSVRSRQRPDRFVIARSVAPAQVTRADLLEVDVATADVIGEGRSYLERHIHAGVYRARPEVQAVVHNHAPALIPFGVTGVGLRPVAHVAGFLGAGVPVFDIRDELGPATSMLVDSPELGDRLARALGDAAVVLMRGHGATVVGTSLEQVVYRSIYSVQNAKLQAEAMRLGPVTYLSHEEAQLAAATIDGSLVRVWSNWVRTLPGRASAGSGETR